tara:strand:- start:116 stop:1588 length:1473 start_codon:yes stop_codon:yes gene_type:complete
MFTAFKDSFPNNNEINMFFGGDFPRNRNIDNNKYYELLGINKNATSNEIKKSFHKLAMKHHPDKGGDAKLFQEITQAHDVLSNPEKKEKYDQFGEEGINNGISPEMSNIFDMMNGGVKKYRQNKGKSVKKVINVSLEQIYSGSSVNLSIKKQVIDKSYGKIKCRNCEGNGNITQTIRIGPMIQEIQQACDQCKGKGVRYKKNSVSEKLVVDIPKGSPNNHTVIYYEKSDEIPNGTAGDLHVILKEINHPVFKRKGYDLYVEKTISLYEALCGYTIELKHLDGRKIIIKSDSVTNPISFNPFDNDQNIDLCSYDSTSLTESLQPYARVATNDISHIKYLLTTGKLVDKGIVAFVSNDHETKFYQQKTSELIKHKVVMSNSKLYIISDKKKKLITVVKGEGLPVYKNPTITGNLFILLDIEFPKNINVDEYKLLSNILPQSKHNPKYNENDENTNIYFVEQMDPSESQKENVYCDHDATMEEEGHEPNCTQQ